MMISGKLHRSLTANWVRVSPHRIICSFASRKYLAGKPKKKYLNIYVFMFPPPTHTHTQTNGKKENKKVQNTRWSRPDLAREIEQHEAQSVKIVSPTDQLRSAIKKSKHPRIFTHTFAQPWGGVLSLDNELCQTHTWSIYLQISYIWIYDLSSNTFLLFVLRAKQ